MEVYKSILKIQGRSLRLALEASVAEMKGRRATFSLECQAGSQLLLQKDQPRPKRWRLQRNLRAHLGPSGVKLRARALTAREDGGGREGGSAGALTGGAPPAAAAALRAPRRGQHSSGEERPRPASYAPRATAAQPRPSARPAAPAPSGGVSASRCARGKGGRLPSARRRSGRLNWGSPPSRFGRLLGGYRVS
ncbi:unnamed protein product [Rangifer tarandus platyrhynchus]|uniref:Uncharacterized protein n=2 Tax=Rangifer tarandus platyrhynchus TaxID=3082113 RepID=A0AC59ZX03_RANTA